MKKTIISALAATALLTSCYKESELEKSIWVDSGEYPGLPEYSEWGYNTFGAYINNDVFANNDWYGYDADDAVITSKGDIMTFTLKRPTIENRVSRLEFTFPFKHMEMYEDLAELDNYSIDLSKNDVEVMMRICRETSSDEDLTIKADKGELVFKRVQRVYLNNRLTEVALSGTFYLTGVSVNESGTEKRCKIEEGRFDLGINTRNFEEEIVK